MRPACGAAIPARTSGFGCEYADVSFALFALKAKGEQQRTLVRDAETLRQRLLRVPGVKKVNIICEQAERIYLGSRMSDWQRLASARRMYSRRCKANALTPAGSVKPRGPRVSVPQATAGRSVSCSWMTASRRQARCSHYDLHCIDDLARLCQLFDLRAITRFRRWRKRCSKDVEPRSVGPLHFRQLARSTDFR